MTRPFRLRRSELSTPGTSEKMMAKAASSKADMVFLDLEDAVHVVGEADRGLARPDRSTPLSGAQRARLPGRLHRRHGRAPRPAAAGSPAFEVRFETPPGDQAQVDFAQFQVVFADEPGVTRIVWLFSLVLGYSRLLWARFVLHQDLQTVLRCHLAAFAALGGVPRQILYDRMKTAVLGENATGHIVYNRAQRIICALNVGNWVSVALTAVVSFFLIRWMLPAGEMSLGRPGSEGFTSLEEVAFVDLSEIAISYEPA